MSSHTVNDRSTLTVPAQGRALGPRLTWLHLVSRQAPAALAIIAALAVVLNAGARLNWYSGTGALVEQVPVLLEAGAAVVIAVATRSPFGEVELANGRLIPGLRLGMVLALTVAAIGLMAAGTLGVTMADGSAALARNLGGITGVGLITATVLGGAMAWVGPVAYAAVAEYALSAGWQSPVIWAARPPHDGGAALCAAAVFLAGVVLITVRGPRNTVHE